MNTQRQKRVILLTSLGAVVVTTALALSWDRVLEVYHLYRLYRGPERLLEMIEEPENTPEHAAASSFVSTPSGEETLVRVLGLTESPESLTNFLYPPPSVRSGILLPPDSVTTTAWLSDHATPVGHFGRLALEAFLTTEPGRRTLLRTFLQDVMRKYKDRLDIEKGIVFFSTEPRQGGLSLSRPPHRYCLRTRKYNSGGGFNGFSSNAMVRKALEEFVKPHENRVVTLPEHPNLEFRIVPAATALDLYHDMEDDRFRGSTGMDGHAVIIYLRDTSPDEVTRLLENLMSGNPELRSNAVLRLSRADPTLHGILPELSRALKDADSSVSKAAAYALKYLAAKTPDAIVSLTAALKQGNAGVRQRAIRMLWELAPESPFDPLCDALDDPDEIVRNYAVMALRRMGPNAKRAISRLVRCLNDPYEHVSSNAVYALARIAPDEPVVLERLQELARSGSGRLGRSATRALAALNESAE